MSHWSAVALVVLGASSSFALTQPRAAGEVHFEPYSFRTYDGKSHTAERGHLWVMQDRSDSAKGLIELGFVRLRSNAEKSWPPLVFLPGGPGIPGTVLGAVPVYYELLDKLRAISDVILLDQRGVGTSSPNTACPVGAIPPTNVFASESNFRNALIAHVAECAGYWRGKGVTPQSFSTAESVEDLDDLRRALGSEKLSLLAHSYGTSLALNYVRRHEEHVDRAVLAGVEGPDESLKMPLNVDFALHRISDLAASSPLKDSFPDTYHEFRRVSSELDREPMTVRIRAETSHDVYIPVGEALVQFIVKDLLSDGRKVGRVPALVYSLAKRDPSLIQPNVEEWYNSLTSGFNVMQFGILCSDGWSKRRLQLAREQVPESVFGDVPFIQFDSELCLRMGINPDERDSLQPLWSSARVLLLSGTLDGNTPPTQAEEVLWGFPNGEIVLVKNGFHEVLPSSDVQDLVFNFLSGRNVPRTRVELPLPSFVQMDPAPLRRPAEH